MVDRFLADLQERILIADGAMGTMLQSRGLGTDECQEEWNLRHGEEIKSIHGEYLKAGCDLILTNTFGGNKFHLKRFGLEDKVREFNRAGVRNARESLEGNQACLCAARRQGAFVLGDVGPTGELMEPLGTVTFEAMSEAFEEQLAALTEGGVDALLIETMSDLREAQAAVKAAKETELPVLVSLSFNPGKRGFRTMMGVDIPAAVKGLIEFGADVIGANCGGVSPKEMAEIIKEMQSLTDKPLLAQPNAGKPTLVGGKTIYNLRPEEMAVDTEMLVRAGANIIGGCCGTTPEHLARMVQVIRCMPR